MGCSWGKILTDLVFLVLELPLADETDLLISLQVLMVVLQGKIQACFISIE